MISAVAYATCADPQFSHGCGMKEVGRTSEMVAEVSSAVTVASIDRRCAPGTITSANTCFFNYGRAN